MHTIRGVVFDFGGVISAPQDPTFFTTVQALTGWSKAVVLAGWAAHRAGLDRGDISAEELYRRIAADQGAVLAPGTLRTLAAADYDSWAHANDATLAWARELKASGFKIGILTNMPPDFLPWFDRCAGAFRALADAEVVSGLVRLVKPDPAIYALMAERMGLPPAELFFWDDTLRNVEAARACGWQAGLFTTVAEARTELAACVERG